MCTPPSWALKNKTDKATTTQCLSSFSKSYSCRDWSPIAFEIPILHSKYFFFRYNILQPQFEINANHPIMSKINSLRSTNPKLAMLVTEQLFANAMVSAGIRRHCNLLIWWNFSYAGSVIIIYLKFKLKSWGILLSISTSGSKFRTHVPIIGHATPLQN